MVLPSIREFFLRKYDFFIVSLFSLGDSGFWIILLPVFFVLCNHKFCFVLYFMEFHHTSGKQQLVAISESGVWSMVHGVRKCQRPTHWASTRYIVTLSLCPQLQRSLRGILVSGCPSVRASICVSCLSYFLRHAISCQAFEISYMDSSWNNSWHTSFFLAEFSPFLELCPFEKNQNETCCMPYLMNRAC